MRRVLLPLLAAFVLWRAVPVAAAEWVFTTTANGTVQLIDGGFVITGADGGGGSHVTTYTTTADAAGTVWLLWEYATTDSAHFDRPQFLINGVATDLMSEGVQGNGGIQFEVQPGDVYGFGVWAVDTCCGAGVLTISDPAFVPASPEPSPDPSPEATPLPSVQPSEEVPTYEPTPPIEPSPTNSPQPSPSPDPSPEPSPAPSVEPNPAPCP